MGCLRAEDENEDYFRNVRIKPTICFCLFRNFALFRDQNFIAKVFENIEIRENLFLQMTIIMMLALLQAKVDFVLKYF